MKFEFTFHGNEEKEKPDNGGSGIFPPPNLRLHFSPPFEDDSLSSTPPNFYRNWLIECAASQELKVIYSSSSMPFLFLSFFFLSFFHSFFFFFFFF